MTQSEVNALKVESAKKGLQLFIDNQVKTEEHVLFLKQLLQSLSKQTKLSEDDKKKKTECEADIKRFKEGIEDSQKHIDILRSLIEQYSNNETVKL